MVLRDVYGLPLDEVGGQLGISEGAAKVRLHRARQRLKEMLYEDRPAESRRNGPPDGEAVGRRRKKQTSQAEPGDEAARRESSDGVS